MLRNVRELFYDDQSDISLIHFAYPEHRDTPSSEERSELVSRLWVRWIRKSIVFAHVQLAWWKMEMFTK